ncbi:methyltransferase domain-containing protein [Flavivirga abyssicola]|uniref:methyltransferase domain-containing protein n=1 Tax=Flavivirga abyssicola TaxID=3063533 RepID=UPI0026DFD026|nr:methyltransferase domain-containing protein [Flavivirga sp. MEBiC07777]WVK13651.1 methyltransferase domain-containing protein [Flavivirga sp. MEBiC07777]
MNKCPLCQSQINELLYTNSRGNKYLENYVCDNCGFIYTYPRISNEEINRLYLEGVFSKEARKSSEPDLKKFRQTETWALERLHLLEQKLPVFFSSPKTCLEIGCGTGSFSWLLRSRGHNVKGIEPDSVFVNSALKRYDIDVETLLFDDFNDSKMYDFICNFHVIEHVLDPRQFVKNMYQRLKSNGCIYIECPTIDNIYTNDLDTFFWDVHVNTFSNRSLSRLLESEGFSVNEVFMSRGFVSVIASKGVEGKNSSDNKEKERVLEIVRKAKKNKYEDNTKNNTLRKYKRKLKGFVLSNKKNAIIKKNLKKILKNNNSINVLPQIKLIDSKKYSKSLFHVSAFNYVNAGDTLLPLALQDTWCEVDNSLSWNNQQVYPIVNLKLVEKINKSKGLIIGGGGLFLKDTNANNISGWQWPCSIEMLSKIKVPIVFYAVGYNRFRDQEEFEPFFKENIKAFTEKAVYLGLRNTGSIEAIKKYLPDYLHTKLRFQPCMTTFLSELYSNQIDFSKEKENFVAFNVAFDRSHLRFGKKIGNILTDISIVLKELSELIPLKFYSHMYSDESIIPFLQSHDVKYELVRLNDSHPKRIVEEYIKPKLVIGMRGHAQMIPFGCKTPILSIISHNKMKWFLDDIDKPEWGVDVLNPNFRNEFKAKALEALSEIDSRISYIEKKQKELYLLSLKNVDEGLIAMKKQV